MFLIMLADMNYNAVILDSASVPAHNLRNVQVCSYYHSLSKNYS